MPIRIDHTTKYGGSRSQNASALHQLICEYCFKGNTSEAAISKLEDIKHCIDVALHTCPEILLETSHNGHTHLHDAAHFPFCDTEGQKKPDRVFGTAKSASLVQLLLTSYREAVTSGKILVEQYAELFTKRDKASGHTVLETAYNAAKHGTAYTLLKEEFRDLYQKGIISEQDCLSQFSKLSPRAKELELRSIVSERNGVETRSRF